MKTKHYLLMLGAALIGACVLAIFVPAHALAAGYGVGDFAKPGPSQYVLLAGLMGPPIALLIYGLVRSGMPATRSFLALTLMLIALPALAQAEIATVDGSTVKLSWEAALAALGPSIASIAVTILSGLATILLGRFAPVWLSALLQSRIETTVQTAVDYALNNVQGAAKGKTLSVTVGSAVVADALQRIVDSTSPWLISKVKGGLPELANRVFRKLDLVPEATAADVVAPVVETLPDLAARG